MKIFLVRHGETTENLAGIFQGHNHGQLSELGIKQAQKLSHRLADENFDMIFSSDLQRAIDTAQIIQPQQSRAKIITSQLLRETDLGDFAGKKIAEVDGNHPPKNLESRQSVLNRFIKFLKQILKNHNDKKILIVSHAGFIATGINFLLQNPCQEKFITKTKQDNAALNIFELKTDLIAKILVLNNTDHLV